MNISYIIAFVGSLLAVLNTKKLLSDSTLLVLSLLALAVTLIPFLINLYDYVKTPKNRIILLLDGILKVALADMYGSYKAKKLLQGKWITCDYLCLDYSMYTHDKVYVLQDCLNAKPKEFQNLDRVFNCTHKDDFFTHQSFGEFFDMMDSGGGESKFEFYAEVLGRDDSNNQLSFKFKYENGELTLTANFRKYPGVVQVLHKDKPEVGVYMSLRKMVDCLQYMPIIDWKSFSGGKRRRGVGILHCSSLAELCEAFRSDPDLVVYDLSVFENKWFIEGANDSMKMDMKMSV